MSIIKKGRYDRSVAESGVLEQMGQQQTVYNQNCRLAVNHRFSVLEGYLTQTSSRTQVRLHVIVLRRLTDASCSRPSVLNSYCRTQGAEHRHSSCRGCLKRTRETVLNEIELWAKDSN